MSPEIIFMLLLGVFLIGGVVFSWALNRFGSGDRGGGMGSL